MLHDMIQEIKEIRSPKICYQYINLAGDTYQLYKEVLIKHGLLILQSKENRDKALMQHIIEAMGLIHTHDNKGRKVWNIAPGGTSGSEHLARSHREDEFFFHTDCSYEDNAPDYFGLHVITPDSKGGGCNLLINTCLIIQQLSEDAFKILNSCLYTFRVPTEFYKGIKAIQAQIIDENLNLRYRRDLIDREQCKEKELKALKEFECIISNPKNMARIFLQRDHILLLDNKRFLHARTAVKDKRRHLKRIRFNLKEISCS